MLASLKELGIKVKMFDAVDGKYVLLFRIIALINLSNPVKVKVVTSKKDAKFNSIPMFL